MTNEEELLSRWLHDETPEPPRSITVSDLPVATIGHVGRVHTASKRAPILAAAAVALIVVVLTVVSARTRHHALPPAHTPKPMVSAPTSTALAIGPWGATAIAGSNENMLFLTATNNSIYVENAGPIQRIDPSTGRVLASNPGDGWNVNAVSAADGALWVPVVDSGQSGRFEVDAFDLTTLARTASIPVSFSVAGAGADALLTSSADGTRLAVAFNADVAIIDTAQRRIIHQFAITTAVGALTLSADGSRLYLGEQAPDLPPAAPQDSGGVLHVVDPLTSADLAPTTAVPHTFLRYGGLAATTGGVWIEVQGLPTKTSSRSSSAALYWLPTGALRLGQPVAGSAALTVQNGVVWISASGRVSCADPMTGGIHASVTLPTEDASLGPFYATGGQLYGTYQASSATGGRSVIVRVTPPSACSP